jgi:PAS domain S-box-containing protein
MDDLRLRRRVEGLFSGLDLEGMLSADAGGRAAARPACRREWDRQQTLTCRALIEQAGGALFVCDLGGRQIYSNRACYQLLGYDYAEKELRGVTFPQLWPGGGGIVLAEQVLAAGREGPWSGVVGQRRKDGTVFDAHLTIFPILTEEGQACGIASVIRPLAEMEGQDGDNPAPRPPQADLGPSPAENEAPGVEEGRTQRWRLDRLLLFLMLFFLGLALGASLMYWVLTVPFT